MPTTPIGAQTVTVGTATIPVVGMSADAQIAVLQNLEPPNQSHEYARDGRLYILQREFTIASPGTALFQMATGTQGAQIDYYQIISTLENVKAELVEGATITTTGAAIPAYNLNRNMSDAHDATFNAASTVTGGTVIAAEYITANKHAASGGMTSGKIYTLEPSSNYAFRFINKGNQTTTVFFQMTFAEKYNGHNDIWLGGSADNAIRLRGGDVLTLPMIQGQTLSAVAEADNELGVLRQD